MAEPQDTIDRASAYASLAEDKLRLLMVRLLADVLVNLDPMADVTVAGIISRAQAGGITGLSTGIHRILQTQLLRDLVDGGFGGGGASDPANMVVQAADLTEWRLFFRKEGPGATADNYVLDWETP